MPPFSDSRVCPEMETTAEWNRNVWLLLLCSLEFSEIRQNLRLSSFIVPENGCGSSPDGSKGRAAAGQWRKQCPSRFSAVGGRTLPSYHSSPAGREILRKQIFSLINCLQMFGGGLYLEKRGFLGRSSSQTEVQFTKHVLQQEDQLSRAQTNLHSHLKHVRKLLNWSDTCWKLHLCIDF